MQATIKLCCKGGPKADTGGTRCWTEWGKLSSAYELFVVVMMPSSLFLKYDLLDNPIKGSGTQMSFLRCSIETVNTKGGILFVM